LKQEVKDESEIPDRLDRFQHNLQAGSDVLDQVKKNVPRESPDNEVQDAGEDEFYDAEETMEPINNLDDALDAQTSRAAEQIGNQPMDNVAEAAKETSPDVQEAASVANEAEAAAAKSASKEGDSLLLDAAERAGESAAKDDLITGGPEDILGDTASLLVGGAVFLGGILGSRHKTAQAPAPQQFINFSQQLGA
jgi:cytoskeletal protein RodZ